MVWREALSQSLGDNVSEPLDWDESNLAPYFSGQPGWDGFGSLVLWANLHLLFWLSLVPIATGWMGNSNFSVWPVATYGALLLLCAVAFYILSHALIRGHGRNSVLAKAFGRDFKGKISMAMYVIAIALAFAEPWVAIAFYVAVAVIWLVPDRRIEKALAAIERP